MPVIRREDLVDEKGRTVEVYEEDVDEGGDAESVEYYPEDDCDEDEDDEVVDLGGFPHPPRPPRPVDEEDEDLPPQVEIPEQYQIIYTYNGKPVCPFAPLSNAECLYVYATKKQAEFVAEEFAAEVFGRKTGIGLAVVEIPSISVVVR